MASGFYFKWNFIYTNKYPKLNSKSVKIQWEWHLLDKVLMRKDAEWSSWGRFDCWRSVLVSVSIKLYRLPWGRKHNLHNLNRKQSGVLSSRYPGANTFSNPSERHISFCFHGSLASIHSTNARKVWIILQHHVFIPRETFLWYLTVLTLPECWTLKCVTCELFCQKLKVT